MNNKEAQVRQKDRIPFQQLLVYGVGGVIPIALFNIAGQLIGLIGNISLGLSALWLGVILIIPRLWDAVSDPIVGHFSDNYRSRWGRRRPFLLVGGVTVAISFVLMWWIPDGDWIHNLFPTDNSFQWFQLGYILICLLLFFTACTVFEIPHGALGMEMTNNPHERTRLFSSKSFLGNLFALSTPWLFALANLEYFKGVGGNEADGMKYVSIIIAVLIVPISFWSFFAIKEPKFKSHYEEKKSAFWVDVKQTFKNKTFLRLVAIVLTLSIGFNFVNLLGYYIPIFYVFDGNKEAASTLLGINGTVWAITGLLAVFPLNWIGPKIGKRRTLILAIALMSLAQLSKIICYSQQYPYLVIIPTILLSSGMLFFFTLGSSMVGDICDENDLQTGKRAEGSYYSIFWWFVKMGTALASFVAGLLIVFTEFDESQVTKVDDFLGAVKVMQTKVENLDTQNKEYADLSTNDLLLKIKKINQEAIREAEEFEKEFQNEEVISYKDSKSDSVSNQNLSTIALKKVKILVSQLKIFSFNLGSLNEANKNLAADELSKVSLFKILEIEVMKCQIIAQNLMTYFVIKSYRNENSQIHYEKLITQIEMLKIKLDELIISKDLDLLPAKISEIENDSQVLTQQPPYTLLMMRIVEIGLPLLLCLVSVFFAFNYPLTEEKSQKNKIALDQRNQNKQ